MSTVAYSNAPQVTAQIHHAGVTTLPPASSLTSSVDAHTSKLGPTSKPVLPPIPARGPPSSPFVEHASKPVNKVQRPPSPPPPAQAQSQSQNTNTGYRPLNVRDALTYLDQVKVQFSDQPDVYNRFLDIMKDFKSQAIDTPGVIERVSTLFKGHPTLISGFNTFLPPGYRIECSIDPREPDVIRVTTPSGTTTTTGGGGRLRLDQENSIPGGASSVGPYYQPYAHIPPPPGPPGPPGPPSIHSTGPSSYLPVAGHSRPPLPPHQSNIPNQTSSQQANGKRGPVEFNHAINYVNKIKNRFAGEPETYKQFLEILQTYQKEQRPIQEVYSHVQFLFNSAPDLLDEFKQFLPDITGQPAGAILDLDGPPYYGPKRSFGTPPPSSAILPSGKKKRPTIGERTALGGMHGKTSKRSKLYHKGGMVTDLDQTDAYSYPSSPFDPVRPSITSEEVELFERIRKHIGNKPSYEEFLKTLNLYTQQIVNLDTLVDQVEIFLGSNKELFDWFKSVIGHQPTEKPVERPTNVIAKPDLMHCKTVDSSPSYRIVPKEWQTQPCSGRDQLAWEVLNDEYVSHPIWASEDDGFVASKKSHYEEAMHRCEEERYDYNLNIEANLNVIALLEPIARKIETMTAEEKNNFRLTPGLGGQSKSIYERIIKKVYDKERGSEIIELLYSNPAQVVPVLLNRLKQKDDEWKKAQREWNKIWRELDAKSFYKALDYQGITFKGNDRKAMAVKALVAEIETKYKKQHAPEKSIVPGPKAKVDYQFRHFFKDPEVFRDVTRLIFFYIDRQSGFTSSDREKIRTFIRTFIPFCFHVDDIVPEGMLTYSDDADDEEMAEDDDDTHSTNTEDSESDIGRSPSMRSMSPSKRRNGRGGRNHQEEEATMDLLRDVLTKNQAALDDTNGTVDAEVTPKSPSAPREATPVIDNDAPIKTEETEESTAQEFSAVATDQNSPMQSENAYGNSNVTEEELSREGDKLLAAAAVATAPGLRRRTAYSFFCNTTFYCFFRLYEMVYSRLLKMKELDAETRADPRKGKKVNKVALDLGLYSTRYDDIDLSNGGYNCVLDLIDRFFDGELDQATFEDSIRYIFPTQAYELFTIDKLIHAVIKQIQAITVDSKSVELIRLFRSDQNLESTSPRIMSVYRLRAEEILGPDENLYKISFDTDAATMSIQLLGKDDYMLEPTAKDRYEDYVASYMNWLQTTEGINAALMKPTFLRRSLRPQDDHLNEIYVRSRLQYKIDQDTYHMYYIVGSEDIFIRPRTSRASTVNFEPSAKWTDWLESSSTGWATGLDETSKTSMEKEARKLLTGTDEL
ncbi:Transcriptional regulatory protein sin3 [Apophysomyces ossiformis]|uniref:Transcriptional regulatory protein sin3 n=1 Tax=Apophysomyces ossiformis TaxID=679940 RepID=A0A8H7BS16_9FUNG|nr:Transcriptional regulatory protein sin3 [Apophysomyces ossiformis]